MRPDIIEKLTDYGRWMSAITIDGANSETMKMIEEAIAEITRLRSALDDFITAYDLPGDHCELENAAREARKVLAGAPPLNT